MAALAFLMISNIPYPVLPRVGVRSLRGIGSSVLVFGALGLLAAKRLELFFPPFVGYLGLRPARTLLTPLFEPPQPNRPFHLSAGEGQERAGKHPCDREAL